MNINNLIKMQWVDKEGYLTPQAELHMGQNNLEMQQNLGPEGFIIPSLSSDPAKNQFDALKNAKPKPLNGTVLYDSYINKLKVFTGTNWETITST